MSHSHPCFFIFWWQQGLGDAVFSWLSVACGAVIVLENDCFFCARPSCFLSCGPLSVSPLPPSLLTSLPAHTAEQQVPAACDSAVCWLYTSVYIHECSLIRGFQKEEIRSLHQRATQYFCTVGIGTWNKNSVIKGCTELIQQYASGDITSLHAGFYHVWSCAGFVLYSDLCAAGMAQMIFHILQQE